MDWLKGVFLPESAPEDPLDTRILLLDGHDSHIPTDFMYEYEIHNVKLYYLPSHSSHVLQSLDVSVFSLVKHQYRKEINQIAAYDDTGPVKKIRFIEFYDQARKSALTVSNIKYEWFGADLVPFNLDKVLTSKQVQLGQQAPQTPSKGHKGGQSSSSIIFKTPHNQKQLRKTVEQLQRTEILSRPVRTALSKISKG